MKTFYFLRHGETDWNAQGLVMGQSDIPLNDKGRRQSELLANRLSPLKDSNAVCYSSDLSRAMETAQILSVQNGLQPQPDTRLREIRFGLFEGTHSKDWPGLFPEECQQYRRDMLGTAPPGGETRIELMDRAGLFLQEIAHNQAAEHILVVTHGGTLAAFLNLWFAWEQKLVPRHFVRIFQFDNCSLTQARFSEDRWRILLTNCTRHLESA